MLEFILDPNTIIAFLTLASLEIVLGIDNIILISVIVNRLPLEIRESVRRFGLFFALITRVLLLLTLSWVMGLTETLFTVYTQEICGKDLILFFGGLFLFWQACSEIYLEVEAKDESAEKIDSSNLRAESTQKIFWGAILQIGVLNMVFSLDSVITAVGLVNEISIMIAAVLTSVFFMLLAAKPTSDFIHRYPSIKILALSMLIIVSLILITESFDIHIPKEYVGFAVAFSLGVEALNIRARHKKKVSE
jgi:predicted tellurium resistance membrane protein TerC